MENHHFSWENSLFQWPFSIAMLVITRRVAFPRSSHNGLVPAMNSVSSSSSWQQQQHSQAMVKPLPQKRSLQRDGLPRSPMAGGRPHPPKVTLWLWLTVSYWKWWFIVDFPIKPNHWMVFFGKIFTGKTQRFKTENLYGFRFQFPLKPIQSPKGYQTPPGDQLSAVDVHLPCQALTEKSPNANGIRAIKSQSHGEKSWQNCYCGIFQMVWVCLNPHLYIYICFITCHTFSLTLWNHPYLQDIPWPATLWRLWCAWHIGLRYLAPRGCNTRVKTCQDTRAAAKSCGAFSPFKWLE